MLHLLKFNISRVEYTFNTICTRVGADVGALFPNKSNHDS